MSTGEQGTLHRSRLAAWCASMGALLVLLLVAAPASAHSTLVRSDPPGGGTVAVGRTELSLWFGEPIAPRPAGSACVRRRATAVPVAVSMPTGEIGEFVQLETEPLQRGVLVLEWDTVSADDGHASTGSLDLRRRGQASAGRGSRRCPSARHRGASCGGSSWPP